MTVNKIGINIALLFLVAELSYINTKSLEYMAGDDTLITKLFSVCGAVAFSMVTVLVMKNAQVSWIKVVFPIFDAGLVFLGFNLNYAGDLLGNPVRFFLTVFMALFAGLITYSLGLIEFKNNATDNGDEMKYLKERCNKLGLELDSVKSERKSLLSKMQLVESELKLSGSELNSLKAKLKSRESEIAQMSEVYYKAEVGRIKKKSEANRTPRELEILTKYSSN